MLKIISLDLDGTLLNSQSKIAPGDREAIKRCIDNCIRVVISTGKSYTCVGRIVKELGLTGLHITSNGGLVVDESISPVWINKIDPGVYAKLVCFLREHKKKMVVHHLSGSIYCAEYGQYLEEISDTGEVLTRVDDLLDDTIAEGALMMTYDGVDSDPVHRGLEDMFDDSLKIKTGAPFRMDVFSRDAGKATVMKKILKTYNLTGEELLAIGDSINDIGIIRFAGAGVAMGNAPDTVKYAADVVVSDNNNNGVAEAINKYFFKS